MNFYTASYIIILCPAPLPAPPPLSLSASQSLLHFKRTKDVDDRIELYAPYAPQLFFSPSPCVCVCVCVIECVSVSIHSLQTRYDILPAIQPEETNGIWE